MFLNIGYEIEITTNFNFSSDYFFFRFTSNKPSILAYFKIIYNNGCFTEYTNWWAPMTEDIVIDKNKGKKQATIEKSTQNNNQVLFYF